MKHREWVWAVGIASALLLSAGGEARADVSQTATALLNRAVDYYNTISTPPELSLDQRRLLAVTLAVAELQTATPEDFVYAYNATEAFVTYLPQSDTSFGWVGNAWVPQARTTRTYSSGDIQQLLSEYYDDIGMAWVNDTRQTYTYGSGYNTELLVESWITDPQPAHWENSVKIISTYNGSLLTETIMQAWDVDSLAWMDFSRSVSYFTGMKVDSSIGYINFTQPTNWIRQSLTEYTYTGDLIHTITFNKSSMTTFLYDANNREIRSLNQTLPGPVNVSKDTSVYDGSGNQILELGWSWNGASWTLVDADTTHYTGNRPNRGVHYNFQTSALDHTLYTYDGNGNLIEDIDQEWNGAQWVNELRTVIVYIVAGILDGGRPEDLPSTFAVGQNYPNPFNLGTTIPYTLAGDSRVRIAVCNILGQKLATLIDAWQPAGSYHAVWDGRDQNGRPVASGVYFFRAEIGGQTQVRKMVLLK
jgi:hypothetical protein